MKKLLTFIAGVPAVWIAMGIVLVWSVIEAIHAFHVYAA